MVETAEDIKKSNNLLKYQCEVLQDLLTIEKSKSLELSRNIESLKYMLLESQLLKLKDYAPAPVVKWEKLGPLLASICGSLIKELQEADGSFPARCSTIRFAEILKLHHSQVLTDYDVEALVSRFLFVENTISLQEFVSLALLYTAEAPPSVCTPRSVSQIKNFVENDKKEDANSKQAQLAQIWDNLFSEIQKSTSYTDTVIKVADGKTLLRDSCANINIAISDELLSFMMENYITDENFDIKRCFLTWDKMFHPQPPKKRKSLFEKAMSLFTHKADPKPQTHRSSVTESVRRSWANIRKSITGGDALPKGEQQADAVDLPHDATSVDPVTATATEDKMEASKDSTTALSRQSSANALKINDDDENTNKQPDNTNNQSEIDSITP